MTDRERHLDIGWDLLEQGEYEGALRTARALLAEDADDPEALYLAGCAHLECDQPTEAERMLRAALREAHGPTPARVTLAILMHQTCRFDEAVALAEEAVRLDARDADAWRVQGLALEMRGEEAAASAALARAARLDPERFAEPELLSESAFEAVVAEALEDLPEAFRERLADLPIVARDTPTREMLADLEDPAPDLLGLFVGTPLTEKSVGDITRAPDVVYLFRRNLQRACDGAEELKEEIRITLLHEIGHYLGMTEEDLEAAGYE